jgi:hypothetical protein
MAYSQSSVFWKSRDQIEWSVSEESTVLIKSGSWLVILLVKIEDLPFLVGTVVSVPGDNIVTFLVFSS